MKKTLRLVFLMGIAALVAIAVPEAAISALGGGVRIVFPADKSYTGENHAAFVMTVDPAQVDTVVYRVNDIASPPVEIARESPKKMKDGRLFICREISLDDGENMLAVVGYAKGRVVAYENIDLFSVLKSSLDKSKPPATYRKTVFHVAEKEALCSSCHGKLQEPQKKGTGLKNSVCYACHKGVVSAPYAHGPAAVGDCIACHTVKGKEKYSLTQSVEDLCFRCHGEKKPLWKSKKHLHGPTATGDCTICHSPHASAVRFFLKKETNELCIGCHDEKATGKHVIASFVFGSSHPVAGMKNPLLPDREFSCASCHSPHASNTKELFPFETGGGKFGTCQSCHKK